MMTGAMCVVAPGSSVQLLLAVLIMLIYTMTILKTAPYEEDTEDWSSFIACSALTLTTIGGFALIMDDPNAPTYETILLSHLLIGINSVCFATDVLIVIMFDCELYEVCARKVGRNKTTVLENNERTKVSPAQKTTELNETPPEHIVSIQESMDLHKREIDQMQQKIFDAMHTEHDEHEAMRQKSSNRVQDRIRARAALRQSKTLHKTEMFKDLAANSILQIIKAMHFRSFDKSQHLVQQGEDASEFMVIMKGAATVFRDGKEVRRFGILDFLGEGALVNEGHTRGATVTANMPTQVLVLTRERYEELKMDGTIAQATHERAARMSQSYNAQDAERLAAASMLNVGGEENDSVVEEEGDGDGGGDVVNGSALGGGVAMGMEGIPVNLDGLEKKNERSLFS